jgi:predicted RNA-binding protein with PIN domain
MPVIVDGYNVLFTIAPQGASSPPEAIEAARGRLLRLLTSYLQTTGQSVTVVFDQQTPSGATRQAESIGGVRILYTHPKRTADDDIRRMVEISTAPQTLRVVTSDRELGRDCARLGATVASAKAFLNDLGDIISTASADESEERMKNQSPSDEEMRELLAAFGEADAETGGLLRGAPLHARRRPRRPS